MIRLDVSLNPIGNEAGVAIVGALVNECTRHLDMSYTELRGVVAGRAIGHLLRCHTIALRYLNVEHNTLGREGINEVGSKTKVRTRSRTSFDSSYTPGTRSVHKIRVLLQASLTEF